MWAWRTPPPRASKGRYSRKKSCPLLPPVLPQAHLSKVQLRYRPRPPGKLSEVNLLFYLRPSYILSSKHAPQNAAVTGEQVTAARGRCGPVGPSFTLPESPAPPSQSSAPIRSSPLLEPCSQMTPPLPSHAHTHPPLRLPQHPPFRPHPPGRGPCLSQPRLPHAGPALPGPRPHRAGSGSARGSWSSGGLAAARG